MTKPAQYYWKYKSGDILILNTNINILDFFPIITSEPWVRNVNGMALYFDKQKTLQYTEKGHFLQLLERPMTQEELVAKLKEFVLDAEHRISSIAKQRVQIDPLSRIEFEATPVRNFNFEVKND